MHAHVRKSKQPRRRSTRVRRNASPISRDDLHTKRRSPSSSSRVDLPVLLRESRSAKIQTRYFPPRQEISEKSPAETGTLRYTPPVNVGNCTCPPPCAGLPHLSPRRFARRAQLHRSHMLRDGCGGGAPGQGVFWGTLGPGPLVG